MCPQHRQCGDSRSGAPIPSLDALQRCMAALGPQPGQGEARGWRKRDRSDAVRYGTRGGTGWVLPGVCPHACGSHHHTQGSPCCPEAMSHSRESPAGLERGRDGAVPLQKHGAVCPGCSFPLAQGGAQQCFLITFESIAGLGRSVTKAKLCTAGRAPGLPASPRAPQEPWLHPLPGTRYGELRCPV